VPAIHVLETPTHHPCPTISPNSQFAEGRMPPSVDLIDLSASGGDCVSHELVEPHPVIQACMACRQSNPCALHVGRYAAKAILKLMCSAIAGGS
jgi:hypothetical protein